MPMLMSTTVNFFDFLYQAGQNLLIMFEGFLASFLELLYSIGNSINFALTLQGYFPAVLGASAMAVVSVYVIKLILGR